MYPNESRRLARWLTAMFALWLLSVLVFAYLFVQKRHNYDVVTVRELIVVDDHGIARVRVRAPLPEPITNGRVMKRDDTVSGILIYDAAGNERGGFVTDNSIGNAVLTLDSNVGQEITLVAYPNGGAEFGI